MAARRDVGLQKGVDEGGILAAAALETCARRPDRREEFQVDHDLNPNFRLTAATTTLGGRRHNPITLQIPHLSQGLARLPQWT